MPRIKPPSPSEQRAQQGPGQQLTEEQMRFAIEASGAGVWDWDLVADKLFWTDQCKALFGLPPEETMDYERFLSLLHSDDREHIKELWARMIARWPEHSDVYQVDYRVIWPDGSVHWLSSRSRAVYNEQGKAVHLQGATLDITDLKQAQVALYESEEQLRTLIDSNIIGITISDIDGSVYEANDAFLDLVGYTREELTSGEVQWTALTAPEFQERDIQAIGQLMARGSYATYEKEYTRRDGTRVPILIGGVSCHGTICRDLRSPKPGSTQLVLSFILDLSARREVEQQKDLFMGMAGHELKTPLAALKGTLQLLQRRMKRVLAKTEHLPPDLETFTSDLAQSLENSIRQTDTQARLINELLDVSRITTGRFKLSLQHADLLPIVCSAVEDVRVIEPGRTLQLTMHAGASAPILADATRVGEVVTNYLTNALRYSPADQPVHVDLELDEQQVRVSVRDHGPGLSEEARRKIWQPFQQVKEASIQSEAGGKGLGLGLYICKTLITQHHGAVGVESVPGEGCTFWFTLPLARE